MANANPSLGLGGALVGCDLLIQWLQDGERLKIKDVAGEQSNLFTGASERMVDVSCKGKSVRISATELQHVTARVNRERTEKGSQLFGLQEPFHFEDGGWLQGSFDER